MKYEYAVLGGDGRQRYLAEYLSQNHSVIVWGIPKNDFIKKWNEERTLAETIQQADCILAPIPLTKDGKTMYGTENVQNSQEQWMLENLFQQLTMSHKLYAGAIPREWLLWARKHQISVTDYMNIEEIAWRNAVATAEGTLAEAICHLPCNIQGAHCFVLGFGRCGMMIARLLQAMGAKVTVYARREEVLYKGELLGYCMKDLHVLKENREELAKQNLIVNTIPALILKEELLQWIAPDTLILDIAGSGGGTDFEMAKVLGRNARLCSGLPGKYSPKTSAKILAQWIEKEKNREAGRNVFKV